MRRAEKPSRWIRDQWLSISLVERAALDWACEAPASALSKNLVDVEFTVDKYLTPPNDGRNLALIVVSVGLETK